MTQNHVYRFTVQSFGNGNCSESNTVNRYTSQKVRRSKSEASGFVYRFTSLCFAVLLLFSRMLTVGAYSVMTDKNVFRQHKNDCMKIALTFDDGPSAKYTADILDYLKEEDVHATFFVVGSQARANPELVLREEEEGHEIGNHTDSHPHLRKESPSALREEILSCERTVYELTETRTVLFRPPEGLCTEDISSLVGDLDYRIILWNIDTSDWADSMAEQIASMILETVQSGDIILFHDSVSRKDSQTLRALKAVIPALKERGYRFVTVSELIGTESPGDPVTVNG